MSWRCSLVKGFTVTDDAFAPSADALHNGHSGTISSPGFGFWLVFLLDPAAIAFDEAINNPGPKQEVSV